MHLEEEGEERRRKKQKKEKKKSETTEATQNSRRRESRLTFLRHFLLPLRFFKLFWTTSAFFAQVFVYKKRRTRR
jgi:hypothetical protein